MRTRPTKKNGTKDVMTLCIEALFSVIGAIGILAFAAFLTGSHITDWNGRLTGAAFILLSMGIWVLMELDRMPGGRKKSGKKKRKTEENIKRVIVKPAG